MSHRQYTKRFPAPKDRKASVSKDWKKELNMSRTIVPHQKNEHTNFSPNICGDYVLGKICEAVGAPVYVWPFRVSGPHNPPTFPYSMTEDEAVDTAAKIETAINQNKVELVFAYESVKESELFDGSFEDFIEYCKEFQMFLLHSKGYKCL